MATRSAWLHEKQVKTCRRRAVPEVSTLENPPGAENTGSAWDLPEIKDGLGNTQSSSVEFNTCAYQTKLRCRWYKPARWAGKPENMASLARICKSANLGCSMSRSWGRTRRLHAGACPEDLANAIAAKVVETWKRILNLEWLRFQMQQKSDMISQLQVKRLENEERRRKRIYEDASPSFVNPLSQEPKGQRAETKATEANEVEGETLLSSSTGPSRKQLRESENEFAIGGMRSPAVSASAGLEKKFMQHGWTSLQRTPRRWKQPRGMVPGRQGSTRRPVGGCHNRRHHPRKESV